MAAVCAQYTNAWNVAALAHIHQSLRGGSVRARPRNETLVSNVNIRHFRESVAFHANVSQPGIRRKLMKNLRR